MIEVIGDLWEYEPADVRVITTNGFVKNNGEAVMGRGCAREAKQKFPDISLELGVSIKKKGNIPFYFRKYGIMTLPVKHVWYEKADLDLICESCSLMVNGLVNNHSEWKNVLIPRPGCGNGQLDWTQVKIAIEPLLDDRFRIITWR